LLRFARNDELPHRLRPLDMTPLRRRNAASAKSAARGYAAQ